MLLLSNWRADNVSIGINVWPRGRFEVGLVNARREAVLMSSGLPPARGFGLELPACSALSSPRLREGTGVDSVAPWAWV